jgi:hypothetical protein
MPTEGPLDVARILELAYAAIASGDLVTGDDDEVALHASLQREHRGPAEIDPATEAVLQERLGVTGVPHPRRPAMTVAIGERNRTMIATPARARSRWSGT